MNKLAEFFDSRSNDIECEVNLSALTGSHP